MQHHWLNKQGNSNLIIFFAGWSFDFAPFEFLTPKDTDMIIFYDYNEINSNILNDLKPEFSKYSTINLIAWSMGVYVAKILENHLPQTTKKIAINGTLKPIDDNFGIPQKPFDLTLKHVVTGLQGKFYKNIFQTTEEFERYQKTPVLRSLENRTTELEQLNSFIKENPIKDCSNFYNKAFISAFDKIIPTKNQQNFWNSTGCDIINFEAGHFPFYHFTSWLEIINANQSQNN